MKLIVGLGNPGAEYARTRHNIGRRLVETMASREKVSFTVKRSLKSAVAFLERDEIPVCLAYPLTYMNLSGEAVQGLVAHFEIRSLQDMLVIVDDVALPFGRLRLRGEGSSGGHNGLLSVEQHLGSRKYPRLRMGIGGPDGYSHSKVPGTGDVLKDHVLSAFSPEEEKGLAGLLTKGQEACRLWTLRSLAESMQLINGEKEGK